MLDYKILKMGLEEGKFEMKNVSKSAERFRKNPEEILKKEGVKNTAESYAEKAKDLYDSSVNVLLKAKEKVYGKFNEIARQKELKEKYLEMKKEAKFVSYNANDGAVGAISRDLKNDNAKNLMSHGYFDCSGVILQTSDGVALLHISPKIIKRKDDLKNYDYPSFIAEAMHYLAMEKSDYEKVPKPGWDESTKFLEGRKSNKQLNEFTEEEISKLNKELRITIVGGESLETRSGPWSWEGTKEEILEQGARSLGKTEEQIKAEKAERLKEKPKILAKDIYEAFKTGKSPEGGTELPLLNIEPVFYNFDSYSWKGKEIIASPKDILLVNNPPEILFSKKEKYYDLSVKE